MAVEGPHQGDEAREAYASGELSLIDFGGINSALLRRQAEVEARIRERPATGRTNFADLVRWADVDERIRQRRLDPDQLVELHDWLADWIERVVITPALRQGRKAIEDVPARVHIEWR